MRQATSAERVVRDIRRKPRRRLSAEEKIRIVLEGLRGVESLAALCRREGLNPNLYYRWSKEFLEASKKRLLDDTTREATSSGAVGVRVGQQTPIRNASTRLRRPTDLWPMRVRDHGRGQEKEVCLLPLHRAPRPVRQHLHSGRRSRSAAGRGRSPGPDLTGDYRFDRRHASRQQAERGRFHREAVGRLGRRRDTLQRRLDRGYEDLLSGKITEQLWTRKSRESESELDATLDELASHDHASSNYAATGARILELSQRAYSLYVSQERAEQRRLLNTLLSNCTFERGSLTPTYNKPFDLLVAGNETGEWLGGRDSNPDSAGQSRVSCR